MFARRRARGKVVYYATFMYRGSQVNELVSTDKRDAERVERQRKREVREGRYVPGQRTGSITIAAYADTWGKARKNRTAKGDRQRLHDHFVATLPPGMRMHDFGEPEAVQFVRALAARVTSGEIAARTARHIRGVARTMFRDARLDGVVPTNPFAGLPRGMLPKVPRSVREVYTRDQVQKLLYAEEIPWPVRALLALLMYLGVREGEACGRRWRDWDRDSCPLGAIHVHDQYDGQPLKTDNARRVPVHPELARILTEWHERGFELFFRQKPSEDDFIVPSRHPRSTGRGAHTKSSAYKAMRRACSAVGVRFEGCHLTRHTMITWARRGGAPRDVIERITHNAAGAIVDQYTHYDWEPLCAAVEAIDYGNPAAVAVATTVPASDAAPPRAAVRLNPSHVVRHDRREGTGIHWSAELLDRLDISQLLRDSRIFPRRQPDSIPGASTP